MVIFSFGKMAQERIDIIQSVTVTDAEGFGHKQDNTILSTRAFMEARHGTEKWANLAAFSTASAIFRFRKPPVIIITTQMEIVCSTGRYRILNVEDVRGRGRYYEATADLIKATVR
jgi:hypothetical protein